MRPCQLVLISHMHKHPVSQHLHHVLPPRGYKVCCFIYLRQEGQQTSFIVRNASVGRQGSSNLWSAR